MPTYSDIFDNSYNESLKNISSVIAAEKENLKIVKHIVRNPIKSRLLTELFRRKELATELEQSAKAIGDNIVNNFNHFNSKTTRFIKHVKSVKSNNKERKEENKTSLISITKENQEN